MFTLDQGQSEVELSRTRRASKSLATKRIQERNESSIERNKRASGKVIHREGSHVGEISWQSVWRPLDNDNK